MFTTNEIEKVTRGRLCGGSAEVLSVSTDTRTIEKGALFIAVKGERFDGNDYIQNAAENGAAAAVSDREYGSVNCGIPIIYVEDSRAAQLELAGYYRDKFPVKLCGVTGSVGKTSTKDMIFAVLSAGFSTLKTEGNFNNDIGLPRTLFRLNSDYGAAVIEMGMSARGEISVLTKAAHPDCAVITNIGWCHIESLKTRENILAAKLEILDGTKANAPLIVCGDDEYLGNLSSAQIGAHKLIKYGFGAENDIRAENIRHKDGGEEFSLIYGGKVYDAKIPIVGEHNILNALAAFAVGTEFGMTPEQIIPAFMNCECSGLRQKTEKRGGITVILDCYNASPTSMKSSLSVLSTINGRKIAVLGDMLELGEQSRALHAGLAEFSNLADEFYLYGGEMSVLRDELIKRKVSVVHSENKEELTRILLENIKRGDVILFKGSRGMKMEEIAEKIGDGI